MWERIKIHTSFYLFLGPILSIGFLLPLFTHAEITENEIIISEIMINPESVSDSQGEWFEIYNNSDSEKNLIDCIFSDNGTNQFTITTDIFINPNEYITLGRNIDPLTNGGVIIDYKYTGFSLANSEDEIIITCQDQEIDRVEYSDELNFSLTSGSSIILSDLSLDNNIGENWCNSTISYGDGDLGSPSGPNDECQDDHQPDNPPIENKPPIAEAGPDQFGTIGKILKFDASQSHDPDGDTLAYTWDFGDNQILSGKIVEFSFTEANVYSVVLRVDDGNITQADSLTVTIQKSDNNNQTSIFINEVLPNPAGSDQTGEWIELYNNSNENINLSGYALADATEKKYKITSDNQNNLILQPNNYFLLFRQQSKISLNNTKKETVYLYNPNGLMIDQISYQGSAKENYSYARFTDNWRWTNILTPGNKNILSTNNTSEKQNQEITKIKISDQENDQEKNIDECQNNIEAKIIINELWPSPLGDDRELEFIELLNLEEQEIDICGYTISDLNHDYTFPNGSMIEPFDFLTIDRQTSRISLNNNGDTITLSDPNKKIIQTTTYPKAPTNLSWSRNSDNKFDWVIEATPADDNYWTIDKNLSTDISEKTKVSILSPTNTTQISEIVDYPANSKLTVSGVITCPPNILGSQIMYITNEMGLEIYQHYKDWPDLHIGDTIEAYGTISYVNDIPRLKIKQQDDIHILSDNLPSYNTYPVEARVLDDTLVSSLIKVDGEIIEKKKNKLYLDHDGEELIVYIKPSTGIVLPEINEGDILEITGILTKERSGYQLLPRASDDFHLTKVKGFSFETNEDITKDLKTNNFINISNYLLITISGIILIILGKIYQLKKAHGNNQEQKKSSQAN